MSAQQKNRTANYEPPQELVFGMESSGDGGRFTRFLLFGLLVFALVASILMLFAHSELWMKVAVIAALWSAGMGAFLVSRYSSRLAASQEYERQLIQRHKADLAREKAQSQQREAELRNEYTTHAEKNRDAHIEALREELAFLREQLTALSGQDFRESAQRSVHARAERVHELEEPQQPDQPKPAEPRINSTGTLTTGSFAAVRWEGHTEAGGTHTRHARPQQTESSTQASSYAVSDAEQTAHIPLVVDHDTNADRSVRLTSTGVNPAVPSVEEGSGSARHGRRRAGGSQPGLTVAELLARSKK